MPLSDFLLLANSWARSHKTSQNLCGNKASQKISSKSLFLLIIHDLSLRWKKRMNAQGSKHPIQKTVLSVVTQLSTFFPSDYVYVDRRRIKESTVAQMSEEPWSSLLRKALAHVALSSSHRNGVSWRRRNILQNINLQREAYSRGRTLSQLIFRSMTEDATIFLLV